MDANEVLTEYKDYLKGRATPIKIWRIFDVWTPEGSGEW